MCGSSSGCILFVGSGAQSLSGWGDPRSIGSLGWLGEPPGSGIFVSVLCGTDLLPRASVKKEVSMALHVCCAKFVLSL